MMKFNLDRIFPLNISESPDGHFRVSWGRGVERLAEALRAVGECLQPIVVWSGGDALPRVVHGFRRIEAARRLGWTELPAVALPADWPEREVFLAGLHLFLATDAPNPVEASLILRKLERYCDRAEIIEQFMPLLGLQPAAVIHQRTRAIWDLPDAARRGLAGGSLDPACAHYLELFHPSEREAAAALILALRPSKSLQKELLETLHDLCMRDGQTIEEIIAASPLAPFPEFRQHHNDETKRSGYMVSIRDEGQTTSNLPQLRETFRQWLRARRFPILTEQERRFEAAREALDLPPAISLTPPPYFEGARHEIRFAFSSAEEYERLIAALDQMRNQRAALEQLWGPDRET